MQLLLRFLIGALVVSVFAFAGDLLRPKSFAGLFGAAPSVALATLALTAYQQGATSAALEARSMSASAIAFVLYACLVSRLMSRGRWPAAIVSIASLALWGVCAGLAWFLLLREAP
jgi:uncharacterized membrane protein (GlpM family)